MLLHSTCPHNPILNSSHHHELNSSALNTPQIISIHRTRKEPCIFKTRIRSFMIISSKQKLENLSQSPGVEFGREVGWSKRRSRLSSSWGCREHTCFYEWCRGRRFQMSFRHCRMRVCRWSLCRGLGRMRCRVWWKRRWWSLVGWCRGGLLGFHACLEFRSSEIVRVRWSREPSLEELLE